MIVDRMRQEKWCEKHFKAAAGWNLPQIGENKSTKEEQEPLSSSSVLPGWRAGVKWAECRRSRRSLGTGVRAVWHLLVVGSKRRIEYLHLPGCICKAGNAHVGDQDSTGAAVSLPLVAGEFKGQTWRRRAQTHFYLTS